MSLNVDQIAPLTDEIGALAFRRADEIVKAWGRLHHVWGTGGTYRPDGTLQEGGPSIRHLAAACYAQGVRDAVAVAATMPADPQRVVEETR